MKRKILLIDESLTVQKVVALTLDKERYSIYYAKAKTEAIKEILENTPDVILLSDSLPEIPWQSFPKEVETWLSRNFDLPAIILVTTQDITEARHYSGVLKKPFTPQGLKSLISAYAPIDEDDKPTQIYSSAPVTQADQNDDHRLEKAFNDVFHDEEQLLEKTFEVQKQRKKEEPPMNDSSKNLWGMDPEAAAPNSAILGASDSMAYKATLESQVERELNGKDLDAIVDRVLTRVVPPIVERLVQERLDALLKEQERI